MRPTRITARQTRDPRPRLRYDAGERRPPDVNQPFGVNSLRNGPDGRGRFGEFGGRFVAETLMPLILEVEQAYEAAKRRPGLPGRAGSPT